MTLLRTIRCGKVFKPALLCAGLTAFHLMAATGESLIVTGSDVNVRKGPSTRDPVIMRLQKGQKVEETGRQGEWVKINTGTKGKVTGWVHTSLLGKYAPALVPGKGGGQNSANMDFSRFMTSFEELNVKIRAETGQTYFTGAADLGNGIVQITATDAWVNAVKSEKATTLKVIFNLWDQADTSELPIAVYIVDQLGTHHMSMYR